MNGAWWVMGALLDYGLMLDKMEENNNSNKVNKPKKKAPSKFKQRMEKSRAEQAKEMEAAVLRLEKVADNKVMGEHVLEQQIEKSACCFWNNQLKNLLADFRRTN